MLLRGTRIPPRGMLEQALRKPEACPDLKVWEQVLMWVEVEVEVEARQTYGRVLESGQVAEGLDAVGWVEVLGAVLQVERMVVRAALQGEQMA